MDHQLIRERLDDVDAGDIISLAYPSDKSSVLSDDLEALKPTKMFAIPEGVQFLNSVVSAEVRFIAGTECMLISLRAITKVDAEAFINAVSTDVLVDIIFP